MTMSKKQTNTYLEHRYHRYLVISAYLLDNVQLYKGKIYDMCLHYSYMTYVNTLINISEV